MKYTKNDDFDMVAALIKGGFNGYNERIRYFNRAIDVFKAEHLNVLKKEAGILFEGRCLPVAVLRTGH